MAPGPLAQVLRPLQDMFPEKEFPQLLVGLAVSDDAAVYRINGELAVILTLDFITPVVDDPRSFGMIAAANALSDIYAMGGDVVLALNICAFPRGLPREMVIEIMKGGAEKVREAGGVLAGGHSIDDEEPKYGLVAMGFVHPDRILLKSAVRPGDILILTKPLGSGVITTAYKADKARPEHMAEAVSWMTKLNKRGAAIVREAGVSSCTDITGFALIGHAAEMALKSGVAIRLFAGKIPFMPGAEEYAAQLLFPGGTGKNRLAYERMVEFAPAVSEEIRNLLFTPETSGGLLAAVAPEAMETLSARFREENEPFWIVGEAAMGEGIEVIG